MTCKAVLRALGATLVAVFAVSMFGCSPAAIDPELTASVKPKTIDNKGQTATITVEAADSAGKPGTGTVRLTSVAGSLVTPVEVSLVGGTVDADFSCTGCTGGSQKITIEWVTKGVPVSTSVSVTVTAAPVDAGVPDAGVLDAGVPDAGVADAGIVDAGRPDAGPQGDGGLALTVDRARIFLGVGDSSTVRAVLTRGTAGVANEAIDFATSLGTLGDFDGGTTGTTYTARTDSQGVAIARFTESGAAGTATISATNTTTGLMASTQVDILSVQSIQFVSTTCAGTACTIMGVRSSGFNESAQVKFKVVDSLSRGVQGVRVTFSIANPPNGTTVSPESRTDANGEVVANVSSGLTIGAFNVHAVVIANMVQTDSPTIGIRGAKPSNNGFLLLCTKVNLPVYISSTPPLPLTDLCTVTLVDRYGNPVGTGTTVRLNSEAGSVPSSIQTTAFMPTGSNPNEGQGTFNFNTLGVFPPLDVPPLTANAAQYPYPLEAEPSRQVASLLMNPRDGLVTIIAYVRGEEHFFDDNSNGIWDNGERFIDQGEPFVDKNDNNQWDPGEPCVDESPADGICNPPNGRWDSNVTIWTATHVLYTGATDPAASLLSPTNFGVVPRGGMVTLAAYLPDSRFNRIEGGSSLAVRHSATKGSVAISASSVMLDGYGFGLSARYLVNAAGTGMCMATDASCKFLTIFSTWSSGNIATVQVTGATTTDTTASQSDLVTIESTVRANVNGTTATGTIQ